MEQKQYVSALQMYKNCMTKFDRNNDIQLMGNGIYFHNVGIVVDI